MTLLGLKVETGVKVLNRPKVETDQPELNVETSWP